LWTQLMMTTTRLFLLRLQALNLSFSCLLSNSAAQTNGSLSRFAQSDGFNQNEDVLDFSEIPDNQDSDVANLVVNEIGHLPSLREHASFDIDREPEILQQWILDLADGSPLGEGWYEVEINHYQAHAIPGRFLPRPRASLAKLTKEARGVSVGGR
jgi:hypothetical protein